MTRVRVRGFKIFTTKGRRYCYHRKTGERVDLELHPEGSAEFFAACARIVAAAQAMEAKKPRPGTLGGLIAHYLDTDHYRNLAPRTRKDYRQCADYLAPIHDTPLHRLDTPLLSGLHDKAAGKLGWKRGNYVLTFLSQCFKFGIPHGLAKTNPAEGVIQKRRPRDTVDANRPWSPGKVDRVLAAAHPHLRAALALMANTGLDPSDAIAMKRNALDAGATIKGLRGKTRAEIVVPVGRRLGAALDAAPRHDAITVLASTKGTPWTYDGLASAFQRLKRTLEADPDDPLAPGLTMKGLRHTVATALREAGADERTIADLLAQKTTSMAGHYSKTADLQAKNTQTVATLDEAQDRRGEVVKPFRKSVKPKEC